MDRQFVRLWAIFLLHLSDYRIFAGKMSTLVKEMLAVVTICAV